MSASSESDDEEALLERLVALKSKQPDRSAVSAASEKGHRPTLHAAHQLTNATPSGLGRSLAGTAQPPQLLAADASHTAGASSAWLSGPFPAPAETDLELELLLEAERAQQLLILRGRLARLCGEQGLHTPPMNAFERWRMLGAWNDASGPPDIPGAASAGRDGGVAAGGGTSKARCEAADPLLPLRAACCACPESTLAGAAHVRLRPPNAWLQDDLCRAGIDRGAAGEIATAMADASGAAAGAVRERRKQLQAAEVGETRGLLRDGGDGAPAKKKTRRGATGASGGGSGADVTGGSSDRAMGGSRACGYHGTAGVAASPAAQSDPVDVQEVDADTVRLAWRGHSACLTRAMLCKLRSLFLHTAGLAGQGAQQGTTPGETGAKGGLANPDRDPDPNALVGGGCLTAQDDSVGSGSGDDTASGGGGDRPLTPVGVERAFRLCALRLLLRYESIGCAGMHASIGGGVHSVLRQHLGVRFECCASPLNAFHGAAAYCSAFADTDAPFGSLGSFSAFAPTNGAYELNPPFVPGLIDAAVDHALRLLSRAAAASEALTFVLVLPGWLDSLGYAAVAQSPHTRNRLLVAAVDHGFVDGAVHVRPSAYRQSPFDTCIFVCQTDAAHEADGQLLAALERALAECTPTPEAIAAVPMSERARGGRGGGHGRVGRKLRKRKRGGKGKERG
jgi:hypothetical protein